MAKKIKTDGPKKNKTSYMYFCMDERENIKKEGLVINNKEILVELGVRWAKVKEENSDRYKKFVSLAEEDKIRYTNDKKNNVDSVIAVSTDNIIKSDNKDKDNSEPKKTKVNGYINYCKKNREQCKLENPDIIPKNITKKLSEDWKLLSDVEKDKYKNLVI
jgi:hypothetical protein